MGGHDVAAQIHPVPHTVPDAEATSREVQALAEGVVLDDRVECMGGHYRIGAKVGLMPLMRFAKAATSGADSSEMEGMAAMYDLLKDCIHADDWGRFQGDMTAKQADDSDLWPVINRTLEILAARPTQPPPGSSSGRPEIGADSTAVSSSLREPDWVKDTVPVTELASRR